MPSKKLNGGRKFVEVIWADISGWSSWHTLDDALKLKPVVCCTRGWILLENDAIVILSGSYIMDDDTEQFGDISVIPTSVIKRKRVING